jgi:catechol 2,3-dioxygenase-like lactoylglutathione lyase family enzyme
MGAGMIEGVNHIGITVPDVAAAAAFFELLLGSQAWPAETLSYAHIAGITGYPDAVIRVAILPVPSSTVVLELIEYLEPPTATVDMETFNVGNSHVAFGVDDLDAALRRLAAAGVYSRSGGPVEALEGSLAGARFAYIRGPGGITVELCEGTRW